MGNFDSIKQGRGPWTVISLEPYLEAYLRSWTFSKSGASESVSGRDGLGAEVAIDVTIRRLYVQVKIKCRLTGCASS